MSSLIHVKLPDGSVKDVPKGTTALDIARGISPRLADAALAAQIKPASNGNEPKLVDLTRPIEEDVELRLLTERDPEALEVFRHSSPHHKPQELPVPRPRFSGPPPPSTSFPRPSSATAPPPRTDSSTTSTARSPSRPTTSPPPTPRCRR